MRTLKELAADIHLRAESVWADRNPHMDGPEHRDMTHWRVTLRARIDGKARRMTVAYSMGSAHTGEPEAVDVLDCLLSDASGVENARDFDDWCAEYGYDVDSRKANRIYRVCEKQGEAVRRFLGRMYPAMVESER